MFPPESWFRPLSLESLHHSCWRFRERSAKQWPSQSPPARPRSSLPTPLGSVATMTSYIVNVSKGDAVIGSIEEKSIYAVGLTLFLMTLVMNIISQFVLRRFREVYN